MELLVGLFVIYLFYRLLKACFHAGRPSSDSEPSTRHRHTSLDRYASGKPAQWHASGESVKVKGHHIPGGLIYVGETLLDAGGYSNDACLINPKLPVSPAEPWEAGDQMGYWPRYDQIPTRCRGAYLKWLTTGRQEPQAYIGYVFLFFYGLERRLLLDGQRGEVSERERSEIVAEVRRLLAIYGSNRSFRGYASNFLATEWALYRSDQPIPDYVDFTDRYCSEPFQVVLARHVAAGRPIPADMALQWIHLRPECGLRTPARRCAKEFRTLFMHRYTEKFGDGLVVKPNKTRLKLQYRAASPSLGGYLDLAIPDLPNPFILSGPLKRLSALAEECTTELEAYSRHLGRKGSNPQSLAARATLPKELLNQSPGLDAVRTHLAHVCRNGPGLITMSALYEVMGEPAPAQFGKKECEMLAALLEALGYGMTPDVRYHGIKPGPDGTIAIFPQGHGTDFIPSREFRTVGTILRLGAMVSQIDQDLSPTEERVLQDFIRDNRQLNKIEQDSLTAFLHWCLRTSQSAAGLKQRLAELSPASKTAISHILISVAHADGRIDSREVKQLEKLYATLGLDKEQVASDIHTLAASADPITIRLRDPGTDFAIPQSPPEPSTAKGFRLNEELIRIREEETRQVKGVLEDIFSDPGQEDDTAPPPAAALTPTDPLAGLDGSHQSFLQRLLAQETWDRAALCEICRELGLMADGAMEVLNEWAYANANAPLIEDGDPVYIDVNLAKEITNA